MNAVVTAKSVLMLGLAGWMTIAVLNNVTDPGTNRFHLGMMFEMTLLAEEPDGLGQNLRWRAFPRAITPAVLWGVVAIQIAVAAYPWKAAWGVRPQHYRAATAFPPTPAGPRSGRSHASWRCGSAS